MTPFKCICVNCFNRLRDLAKVITKLQKFTFLDNLMTITQEGNMDTRKLTSFFPSFFRSNCFVNFISEFENTHNSSSCGHPLVHSGL